MPWFFPNPSIVEDKHVFCKKVWKSYNYHTELSICVNTEILILNVLTSCEVKNSP